MAGGLGGVDAPESHKSTCMVLLTYRFLYIISIQQKEVNKIYLTQSNVIRGLSKEEYSLLREMCQYSNNLYNAALYNIRQYYFQEKKFLKYEENYHVCKENENYGI